jgi:diguanylate cyclase (GGDEF)-like protein
MEQLFLYKEVDGFSLRNLYDYKSLHIAIFDLDHLDGINDEFGESLGDAILTTFADVLQRTVQSEHLISRIGGKRFAVVIADSAQNRVDAICNHVRRLIKLRHIFPLVVTVSIGIAQRASGEFLAQTLARAEMALSQAKRAGRNRTFWLETAVLEAAE